ncbi:CDP-diacylglycerol--glycerol-3-phosphate 3-phosphatidyltransferase [Ampullimonas aquatilis]|uniref:CDP-diacylglycerol--glycerol-3-phosphate 3-phosphatidyltransferase n=1 Tax=Ampullimonas aquatilis TaxID=1341549 RepID=UPI003C7963D4
MPFNLPIFLTWLRILLIPLLAGVYYLPNDFLSINEKNLLATLIFIVAALTDWFDGFLARRLKQTSAFGAFLDPVADKLMVMSALIVLLMLGRVSPLIAIIIIGREITISALREWMAQLGATKSVAVNSLGKIKTTAQMLAIPFLLLDKTLSSWLDTLQIGTWLIYVAALLTVVSMLYYLKLAMPKIRERSSM